MVQRWEGGEQDFTFVPFLLSQSYRLDLVLCSKPALYTCKFMMLLSGKDNLRYGLGSGMAGSIIGGRSSG